ncbi:MAG: hypothetical protein QXE95_05750 [Candidatus Nitrosocaldus sp.]
MPTIYSMYDEEFKKGMLRMLKEDEEFRYAVAGLIGLEDIRASVARLQDSVAKLEDSVARLQDSVAKLEDSVARLQDSVAKLEDSVARLQDSVARLIDTQTKTELAILSLRKEVGVLANNFGFTLEEIAATKLPRLLMDEGITIRRSDIRLRHHIRVDSKEREVDVYVKGKGRDGKDIIIIGEVKGRIDRSDVKRFDEAFKGIDAFKFIFGHTIRPEAEDEATERGIRLYATYM